MEFDEALDIQILTMFTTMPGADSFRVKLLGQRLFIREQLHMFKDIKNSQQKNSAAEGMV